MADDGILVVKVHFGALNCVVIAGTDFPGSGAIIFDFDFVRCQYPTDCQNLLCRTRISTAKYVALIQNEHVHAGRAICEHALLAIQQESFRRTGQPANLRMPERLARLRLIGHDVLPIAGE